MKISDALRKYLGQIMNTKSLLLILLIGVALLILPGKSNPAPSEDAKEQQTFDREGYTKELEKRLAAGLSSIRGVGSVSVMITLEDEGQSVYAQNEKTENRALSGSAEQTGTQASDDSYVLKNDAGGGQSPLLLKNRLPRVSGVLVTAEGADDAEVKNNLSEAVKAVLDVKPHRIRILSQ